MRLILKIFKKKNELTNKNILVKINMTSKNIENERDIHPSRNRKLHIFVEDTRVWRTKRIKVGYMLKDMVIHQLLFC